MSDTVVADAKILCDMLTADELTVLQLSAKGYSSNEVGELMGCSGKTIELRRSAIRGKFEVNTLIECAVIACKAGVV